MIIDIWQQHGTPAILCRGYLNDMGQPLYDIFGPKDKTAFRRASWKMTYACKSDVSLQPDTSRLQGYKHFCVAR